MLPDTIERGTCFRKMRAHLSYGGKRGAAMIYDVVHKAPDGTETVLPLSWQEPSKPAMPMKRGIFLSLPDGSCVKDSNGDDRAFMSWPEVVAFWPTFVEMHQAPNDG